MTVYKTRTRFLSPDLDLPLDIDVKPRLRFPVGLHDAAAFGSDRQALVARLEEGFTAYTVPVHLRGGLVRYVADGILPGGFLQAVLCNNLCEAITRGRYDGVVALPALVDCLTWHMPPEAWGTREKVLAWTTTPDRLEIAETA